MVDLEYLAAVEHNEKAVQGLRRLQTKNYRDYEVAIARQMAICPAGDYPSPQRAALAAFKAGQEAIQTDLALRPEDV